LQGWKDLWLEETPNIEILSHEEVDLDSQEGQTRFSEINANAIRQGFEGIMIKDPQAPYECKRSVSWLKQKPFLEVSLEVKDVEEGTGKNLGRMGALVCFGFDDGREISVNVGSGFSDSLRLDVWADVGSVIGSIVEVRADAVTQNQDGTYSLRFPRFLRFRGFVPGEKI
jgi:DNA ligase-1